MRLIPENFISHTCLSGIPIPQQRPRLGKWGTYNPCSQQKKSHQLELSFQEVPRAEGAVLVFIFYYFPPKKNGKLNIKPDIDNLIKYTLDVGNTILYEDDKQIVGVFAQKKWGEPRTEVLIYKHQEST